jgi:hypothetical protein
VDEFEGQLTWHVSVSSEQSLACLASFLTASEYELAAASQASSNSFFVRQLAFVWEWLVKKKGHGILRGGFWPRQLDTVLQRL